MSLIRVGVVRGGPSSEYVVSLKTGESVLRNLDRDKYSPIDILITPRGDWYMNGIRTDLANINNHVDVIWNAMHGAFGEDGKVQQHFEAMNIPYTGSGVMASAVGMHKQLAKDRFIEAGLRVPEGEVIPGSENMFEVAFELFRNRHMPVIVKPVSGGSSLATKVVRTYDELREALVDASQFGDVLVEDFIPGKEATVCVIDSLTPGESFVLYPIEIVPPNSHDIFDFESKYSGESEEICPGRFPLSTHGELRELALRAHHAIGARHYSRADFIIASDHIYLLEINTLPGLTEHSLLPKALKAGNVKFSDFVDHVITLAMKGNRYPSQY
jgi:D-alanine-D-alanine ligase